MVTTVTFPRVARASSATWRSTGSPLEVERRVNDVLWLRYTVVLSQTRYH